MFWFYVCVIMMWKHLVVSFSLLLQLLYMNTVCVFASINLYPVVYTTCTWICWILKWMNEWMNMCAAIVTTTGTSLQEDVVFVHWALTAFHPLLDCFIWYDVDPKAFFQLDMIYAFVAWFWYSLHQNSCTQSKYLKLLNCRDLVHKVEITTYFAVISR
jgi:hypothetical protein